VRLPPGLLDGGAARGGAESLTAWRRWAKAQGACLPLDRAWQPVPERTLIVDGRAYQVHARRGDEVLASHRRRLAIVSLRTRAVIASARDDDEAALDALSAARASSPSGRRRATARAASGW
jgi:hypothetical protein